MLLCTIMVMWWSYFTSDRICGSSLRFIQNFVWKSNSGINNPYWLIHLHFLFDTWDTALRLCRTWIFRLIAYSTEGQHLTSHKTALIKLSSLILYVYLWGLVILSDVHKNSISIIHYVKVLWVDSQHNLQFMSHFKAWNRYETVRHLRIWKRYSRHVHIIIKSSNTKPQPLNLS